MQEVLIRTKGNGLRMSRLLANSLSKLLRISLALVERDPEGRWKNGGYELGEPTTPYSNDFDPQNAALNQENTYFWNESN